MNTIAKQVNISRFIKIEFFGDNIGQNSRKSKLDRASKSVQGSQNRSKMVQIKFKIMHAYYYWD